MEVVYTSRFKKDFNKLSTKVQNKILSRIEMLVLSEYEPILNNHKLHGDFQGHRSVNATGNVRIVYKKIGARLFLVAVGSHSQLY